MPSTAAGTSSIISNSGMSVDIFFLFTDCCFRISGARITMVWKIAYLFAQDLFECWRSSCYARTEVVEPDLRFSTCDDQVISPGKGIQDGVLRGVAVVDADQRCLEIKISAVAGAGGVIWEGCMVKKDQIVTSMIVSRPVDEFIY